MSSEAEFEITEAVHQILIADDFGLPAELPPMIAENVRSARNLHRAAQYRLWDGNSLRQMIRQHYEGEVLEAFELLRPYAYKADLARYCLLYLYGGIYVDLGIRLINPIKPAVGTQLAVFKEIDLLEAPWNWRTAQVGVIWAKPGQREFRIAIDSVVDHCRRKYYGTTPLDPTGPGLFGQALVAANAERNQQDGQREPWIGIVHPLTPGKQNANRCYIAPDHSLVAVKTKFVGADLTHLGAVGTNNYDNYWHARSVYGEPFKAKIWKFDDPQIRIAHSGFRTATGIAAKPNERGFLTHGPYIRLAPGRYRLCMLFNGDAALPRMKVDVVHESGTKIIHVHEQDEVMLSAPAKIQLEFEARDWLREFEFRTAIFGPLNSEISEFSLERIEPASGVSAR